ncbi:DUF72 domain-containing protein [Bordetella trematum]|uniref:DUF72 domain-containing protein n=1 Tax=Bordetella trematum TaxID=123899 RepID=UPI0039899FDF
MSLLIGTASWTDPTLLACGRFYPSDLRDARARLAFYASRFPLVEADSPYYGLPQATLTHAWAERTPPGFVFNLKLFRLFSGHPTPPSALPADLRHDLGWAPGDSRARFANQLPTAWRRELWRRYLQGLEPLRAAGKLGLVHCQFAPWIQRDARGLRLLDECAAQLEELDASVEWRHPSWWRDPATRAATLGALRERRLVHTIVDAPQGVAGSVPAVWAVTRDDIALLRLHGRNAAAWHSRAAASSSRFQYEYSDAELAELAASIRALPATHTHVVLNTNYQDQGMQNAARLRQALG